MTATSGACSRMSVQGSVYIQQRPRLPILSQGCTESAEEDGVDRTLYCRHTISSAAHGIEPHSFCGERKRTLCRNSSELHSSTRPQAVTGLTPCKTTFDWHSLLVQQSHQASAAARSDFLMIARKTSRSDSCIPCPQLGRSCRRQGLRRQICVPPERLSHRI